MIPMDIDAITTSQPSTGTRCYNCNGRGHFARDCPRQPATRGVGGRGRGRISGRGGFRPRPGTTAASGQERVFAVEDQETLKEYLDDLTQSFAGMGEELNAIDTFTSLPTWTARVNDVSVAVLFDTGAKSIYVSKSLVDRLALPITPISNRDVRTAAGHMTQVNQIVKLPIQIGTYADTITGYVMPIASHDVILGLSWFQKVTPDVDWSTHTYTIRDDKGEHVLAPNGKAGAVLSVTSISSTEESHGTQPEFAQNLKSLAFKLFPNLFRIKLGPVPPSRKWVHTIDTGDTAPIRIASRPHTPLEHQAIAKFVAAALADDVIEPSNSPWSAPLLLVPKPTGQTDLVSITAD